MPLRRASCNVLWLPICQRRFRQVAPPAAGLRLRDALPLVGALRGSVCLARPGRPHAAWHQRRQRRLTQGRRHVARPGVLRQGRARRVLTRARNQVHRRLHRRLGMPGRACSH